MDFNILKSRVLRHWILYKQFKTKYYEELLNKSINEIYKYGTF